MGNFCAGIGFLYPNKKKLILLALLCVPPAFSCVLVPALVAAALDSSLGAAPAAAGVGAAHLAAWLCAHRARHLAAALAADSALHIRRRAFPEFLRLGAAFPPEAALAAELILPAAAFLRRLLALFFLAAALASAAAFSRELRLPALAALLSFPAALLLARVAGSPAGAGRAPGGLAPLVRALPAAKALGGTRFLEEAFREAASCPASLRFRVVPRGAARVHAVGGCAAGLALAAFVFAAGEFFPALGAGTWFFCLCAIPAVFLACARLGGFPPALREALAAVEKLKPQDAWAADRSVSPTRGFQPTTCLYGLLRKLRPAPDAPKPPTRESGGSLHLKGELDLRGLSVFSGDQ
ncbi:MAG: hypothetical protein LBT33_10420, partial [Spirochaetia bacterium]|nr:hypothetical protein [Spirochaetia bacterium]